MATDEDSDSNSLPDLNDLFPAPSNEIVKGDIVWAKFKKLFWPALVRHVYPKEKKVRVWYTDAPGKCFKIPLRDVTPFHDPVMSARVKREAKENGVTEKVETLTSHALSYLNRKAEGYKDDPMKFFDLNYPFFTLEEWLKKNPKANIDDFSDLRVGSMHHSQKPKKRTKETESAEDIPMSDEADADDDEAEEISVDSENASDVDSLSDNDYMITDEKKILESPNTSENEYVNKIIVFIKSGKADKHLEDVLLKNVSSEYVEFFERAIKANKRDLNYISYGPVEDVRKLREISFYLIDLYDNISLKSKVEQSEAKISIPLMCRNNFEKAHFVSSVWLPESIIHAISEIDDVTLSEAKKLFHKKSFVKRDKIENIISTADNGFSLEGNEKNIKQMWEYKDEYTQYLIESCTKRVCVVHLIDVLKEKGEKNIHDSTSFNIEISGECLMNSKKKSSTSKKRRRKSEK